MRGGFSSRQPVPGLYALTTSGAFAHRASDVVKEVRVRASDLPDELMSRVHEATELGRQRPPVDQQHDEPKREPASHQGQGCPLDRQDGCEKAPNRLTLR